MRRDDPKTSQKRYFRTVDRVCNLNGAWYFVTREGQEGPYRSRAEAEREAQRFIEDKLQLQHFQSSRKVGLAQRLEQADKAQRRSLDMKVEEGNLALRLEDDLLI